MSDSFTGSVVAGAESVAQPANPLAFIPGGAALAQAVSPATKARSATTQGSGPVTAQGVSPPLWNRTCVVTAIRRPGGTTFVDRNPQFFETVGNAIVFDGSGGKEKISFDIKKNLGKHPNTCEIKLVNMSDDTRKFLTNKPLRVDIEAGYGGVARLLWTGDLSWGNSKRDNTEWVTTLQLGDGLRAFALARTNKSYRPPVRVDKVLADAAASLGLTLPTTLAQSPQLKQALASGISLHGPTRDVLTEILAPYGFSWSVQNGQLQILRDDDTRPGTVHVVNQQSGLVGSPELTPPHNASTSGKGAAHRGSEVKFKVLLWPELVPGGMVQLESQSVTGLFKITDVSHAGSTRDKDWYTDVTGRPFVQQTGSASRSIGDIIPGGNALLAGTGLNI
jgi:hypothetical protein